MEAVLLRKLSREESAIDMSKSTFVRKAEVISYLMLASMLIHVVAVVEPIQRNIRDNHPILPLSQRIRLNKWDGIHNHNQCNNVSHNTVGIIHHQIKHMDMAVETQSNETLTVQFNTII